MKKLAILKGLLLQEIPIKYLRLPLVLGVLAVLTMALWLQQDNVNSLAQKLNTLQQHIDILPATVAPKDKLALQKDRLILEKDRANAQNAIYGTLVQALGGVFFVVTAYFTWRNLMVAEENLKVTQEKQATDRLIAEANLNATEEKQVTERFSKAIELLGSEKSAICLGGIYALERIAKDSSKDRWAIMEVLISFVQEKSSLSQNIQQRDEQSGSSSQNQENQKITTEVQAALTVIGRRDSSKEQDWQRIELPSTNLKEAKLWLANFRGANLKEANLDGADLTEANLDGADLNRADLTEADLEEADLQVTNFTGANLKGANLKGARFRGTNFTEANLTETKLWQANLKGVNFDEANLKGAWLDGADLTKAINLTKDQIDEAFRDDKTKLPDYLQPPNSSQPEPPEPQKL